MSVYNKEKSSFGYLGLLPLFAAPFFLVNPDYTMLDVVPDFIGYLLLMLGLGKLRDLNSYFEKAADSFGKLAIVSAIKLVLFFIVSLLLDDKERPTMILILMMLFAIGEMILVIPGFSAFFEGFSYSGFTYRGKHGETFSVVPGKIRNPVLVFLIAKYLLTLLPEFSVLAAQTYSDAGTAWDEYTDLFRLTAMFIIAVWGLAVFIKLLSFLAKTLRDKDTLDRLSADYRNSVLTVRGLFIRRRISLLGVLVFGILIFSADFLVDNADILPDFASAILFLLFFILGKDIIRFRTAGITASAVFIPLSALRWWMTVDFRDNHLYSLIRKSPSVYEDFMKYYPVCVLEAVFEAVLILLVLIGYEKIISEHCGYLPDDLEGDVFENKKREIRSYLNKKLNAFAVSAFACTVISGLTEYATSYTQSFFGKFWPTLSIVSSIICLCLFFSLNSEIRTESGYKYMLS